MIIPNDTISTPQPSIALLKQIAAWDIELLNTPPFHIKASVPALQRGLVWSPQQVELLWDSILRGFPIGSLVVGEKVDKQERSKKAGITHHLLDGQQRCNAITLGFHDPFASTSSWELKNKSVSILWLDIAPHGTKEFSEVKLSSSSTREFLTRITTPAHPWGYKSDDNATRLSAAEVREAIEWENKNAKTSEPRPSSLELFPWHTNAPIPFSWLMNAIDAGGGQIKDEKLFWQHIRDRLEAETGKRRWPTLALNFFDEENITLRLHKIYRGICRAAQTQLIIMVAPKDILDSSRQEESTQNLEIVNIASIEHLFNRLNRQGTALNGEELAYSMIKAYWPEVADVIDSVAARRIPASYLVSLSVRAALTAPMSGSLAAGIGISRLRTIANAPHASKGAKGFREYEQRMQIERFIGAISTPDGMNDKVEKHRLARACETVDKWLVFDSGQSPNGLSPILISSFARGSSDIYLFLLHIADRLGISEVAQDHEWNDLLPGLATLVHWYAKSDMKSAIADTLMKSVVGGVSPKNVRQGLIVAIEKNLIITPRQPEELESFIQLPTDEHIAKWKWWPSLIESPVEEERAYRERSWKPFLERTVWQRELLLYAQRSFLNERFDGYDPSRKDLWETHNRPWDFDHIHASFYFYNAKSGNYAEFCRQWGNAIGNLRAWPFEENRSEQKDKAKDKLGGKPSEMKWSLIESENELEAFSLGVNTRNIATDALALSGAIKTRLIRIYLDWYVANDIGALVSLKPET